MIFIHFFTELDLGVKHSASYKRCKSKYSGNFLKVLGNKGHFVTLFVKQLAQGPHSPSDSGLCAPTTDFAFLAKNT